jgi:hypothetical protein
MQGDHQPAGQRSGQAADTCFSAPFLGNYLRDGRRRDGLAEGVKGQHVRELAFGGNLAYGEWHAVAPYCTLSGLALESMPQKPPRRVFERYWG